MGWLYLLEKAIPPPLLISIYFSLPPFLIPPQFGLIILIPPDFMKHSRINFKHSCSSLYSLTYSMQYLPLLKNSYDLFSFEWISDELLAIIWNNALEYFSKTSFTSLRAIDYLISYYCCWSIFL